MRISDWSSDVCSSDLPLQLSRFVQKGCKMPKLKNKSGAKKRFRISGSGKVIASFAGKRHGMRKRPQKMIRNARGTAVLCDADRSEEHTSELQSLMRISYAVFCLKKKNTQTPHPY